MARTQAFETHPDRYERWFEEHGAVYQSELRAVRRLIPPGGEAMEVGVGSGRFAQPLGIREGVEPAAAMRNLAGSRGIKVVRGVAERLPYPDDRFDTVLIVTTICFVDDIHLAFREAGRVLKSGGCLVLGFVDRKSPLGRRYESMKRQSVFYEDATFYSTDEVLTLLEETGFRSPRAVQTVFGGLEEVTDIQEVKEGYGEGGFVVVRAYAP